MTPEQPAVARQRTAVIRIDANSDNFIVHLLEDKIRVFESISLDFSRNDISFSNFFVAFSVPFHICGV